MKFEHDYLIYDVLGMLRVLCMACGVPIKTRSEVDLKFMAKHADYREIPVSLSDGNIAFIMVCDDCKFVEIGEEAKKITLQIRKALRTQLIWEGKHPDLVDAIIEGNKREVLRKAETSEVVHAMRSLI